MPSDSEHIKRADLNEEFSELIPQKIDIKFDYWSVTALFYSALHWIDAFLGTKGVHPHNHAYRDTCLARFSELKNDIYDDYFELKATCENSRYNLITADPVTMQEAIDHHRKIKKHIQKLTSV
jgi:hypothetical protein